MNNVQLALKNFKFLKELKPYHKLTVETTGLVQYDNRWLQSIRRTVDGTTRNRILIAIETTFDTLSDHDPLFCSDGQNVLTHILNVMKKTSPSFNELHGNDGLLNNLLFKLRNYEAQRKAQELLLEKGVNIHLDNHNPDLIIEKEVTIDDSAGSGLISKQYSKSPTTKRINSIKPQKKGIKEDKNVYYNNCCCFSLKRKLK